MSDILTIAKSQDGRGEDSEGGTWCGRWLDEQAGRHDFAKADWCGAFLIWAIAQGGPEWTEAAGGLNPDYAEVQVWLDWMTAHGRISHTPAPRRLVWYDWAGTPPGANHIGMVASVHGNRMQVWEGNHNDKVELVDRPIDSQVMGFGEWWSYIPAPVAAADDSCWFVGA